MTLLGLGAPTCLQGALFVSGHTIVVFNVRTQVKRSIISVRGAYHEQCEAERIC